VVPAVVAFAVVVVAAVRFAVVLWVALGVGTSVDDLVLASSGQSWPGFLEPELPSPKLPSLQRTHHLWERQTPPSACAVVSIP